MKAHVGLGREMYGAVGRIEHLIHFVLMHHPHYCVMYMHLLCVRTSYVSPAHRVVPKLSLFVAIQLCDLYQHR